MRLQVSQRTPYRATGSTVADVAGDATVIIQGPGPFARYELSSVVVSSTRAGTGYPTATVYRSVISPSNRLGFSRIADADTFDADAGDVLLPGDSLVVVFANVLAGATCTVNAFGNQITET